MVKKFVLPIKAKFTGPVGRPRRGVSRVQANKSLTDLNTNLNALAANVSKEAVPVLFAGIIETFNRARYIYAPKQFGGLRESAYLEPIKTARGATIEMGFGKSVNGGSVDYAAVVHERLDTFHKPPTRAKYLEFALLQGLPKIREALAKGVQLSLGLGSGGNLNE